MNDKIKGICFFCSSALKKEMTEYDNTVRFKCPACGPVSLTEEAFEDFHGEQFDVFEQNIISICLRNEFENRIRKPYSKAFSLPDLHKMAKRYSPMSALERMDNALLTIEKEAFYIGNKIDISIETDYPYYHCLNPNELASLLRLLKEENYIVNMSVLGIETTLHNTGVSLTAAGYKRLQQIKKVEKDSRQCFVAMWFSSEMNEVYEKAIKPAIEYKEEGQIEPRFRAVKIDLVEHNDDINNKIIASIRRSRFMVCDLTGYRGGIYFEAGFAYGLGLEVIYTCRKDWAKGEFLKTEGGKEIKFLNDCKGRQIEIKKEGVHFDIAHRRRIEWEDGERSLEEFKNKLTNTIKAIIT